MTDKTMKLIRNLLLPVTSFANLYESQKIVTRAHETFKDKSYLESYKTLFIATSIISYLTQLLSALFASSYTQHRIVGILEWFDSSYALATSWVITFLILSGIEILKRLCLGAFIVSIIKRRKSSKKQSFAWGALLVNILLLCVAIYTSSEGAVEFGIMKSDMSADIQNRYMAEMDDKAGRIQNQIETEMKAMADFKNSASWRGKINMSDPNISSVIASFNRRLEKLQDEKASVLSSLEADLKTDLKENSEKTDYESLNLFWISLLIELTALICIGYGYYFLSRVYFERNSDVAGRVVSTTVNHSPAVKNQTTSKTPRKLKNSSQNEGFSQSDSRVSGQHVERSQHGSIIENSIDLGLSSALSEASSNSLSFLHKYENVVKCLNDGLSNRQVALQCKVSETTVHNVKRCLRSI